MFTFEGIQNLCVDKFMENINEKPLNDFQWTLSVTTKNNNNFYRHQCRCCGNVTEDDCNYIGYSRNNSKCPNCGSTFKEFRVFSSSQMDDVISRIVTISNSDYDLIGFVEAKIVRGISVDEDEILSSSLLFASILYKDEETLVNYKNGKKTTTMISNLWRGCDPKYSPYLFFDGGQELYTKIYSAFQTKENADLADKEAKKKAERDKRFDINKYCPSKADATKYINEYLDKTKVDNKFSYQVVEVVNNAVSRSVVTTVKCNHCGAQFTQTKKFGEDNDNDLEIVCSNCNHVLKKYRDQNRRNVSFVSIKEIDGYTCLFHYKRSENYNPSTLGLSTIDKCEPFAWINGNKAIIINSVKGMVDDIEIISTAEQEKVWIPEIKEACLEQYRDDRRNDFVKSYYCHDFCVMMRKIAANPNIDQVVKMGFAPLIIKAKNIPAKAKTPEDILRLPTSYLENIPKEELIPKYDYFLSIYEACPDIEYNQAVWLISKKVYYSIGDFVSLMRNYGDIIDSQKCIEYLMDVYNRQCININDAVLLWAEYLTSAKMSKADLTDINVVYPASLKLEHDRLAAKARLLLNYELCSNYMNAVNSLKDLEYSDNEYTIICPKSVEALFDEVDRLSQYVRACCDKIYGGQSVILFLHKNNEPCFTIELNKERKLLKINGLNNKEFFDEPEELKEFLATWRSIKGIT